MMNGTTHNLKAALTALALLTTTTCAWAESAESYVKANGFRAVQTEKLEGNRYYSVARIPRQGSLGLFA